MTPTTELQVAPFSGADLRQLIPEVARLRIRVFRDFPYLYEGSEDYEAGYLNTYVEAPGAVVVLARAGDKVIGAATGVPLVHEPEYVRAPLSAAGYDPARVFYFGESVLLPEYRGRGIGVRFLAEREAHARALGGFDWLCFCAVVRPPDHPRRPSDYVPLDAFWRKRGFARHPDLQCVFHWQDLDEDAQSAKPMAYWLKRLD